MKTCVSTYSFGWFRSEGQLGILGTVAKAAEMGFEGIEFVEGDWQKEADGAEKITEKCASCGIVPVNFCVGADLLNCADIKDEIKRVCGLVDIAKRLGATMLRHDVAYNANKAVAAGYYAALPHIADACREITKYAEQKGIRTMTENHGHFSQDAVRVERLISEVNHQNFGVLVDVGNFMCVDEEPTKSVAILAPYAFHVHAKDFHYKNGMEPDPGFGWSKTRGANYIRGAIIGHGDAQVWRSLKALKAAGYDGYTGIEFEGIEDVYQGIEHGLENLKRYIGDLEASK